jgi:hypothetical protein
VCMMKFTKLTSVTLKVGQGDPYTIPSSFSMRGTYTPRLKIQAQDIGVTSKCGRKFVRGVKMCKNLKLDLAALLIKLRIFGIIIFENISWGDIVGLLIFVH